MDGKVCIICKKRFIENSIEHIVPDAIGGIVHIDCVCRNCNNRLGDKVDCFLTEDPTILYARAELRIPNRDGTKVDIYRNHAFKHYDLNNNRVIIKYNDEKKMSFIYDNTISPQVDVLRDENGNAHVQFRRGSDYESVLNKAKKEIAKNGLPIPPDDELKKELFSDIIIERGYKPVITPLTINIQRMIPCICKIAYESSHMVLGNSYLSDALAEQYRKLLYSLAYGKKPDNVIEQVTIIFQPDLLTKENSFRLFREENTLMAQIVILGFLQFDLPISNDADKYSSVCKTVIEISL